MKTSPITANASQLGIPINRRFPMTLSGGASLERLGRLEGTFAIEGNRNGFPSDDSNSIHIEPFNSVPTPTCSKGDSGVIHP